MQLVNRQSNSWHLDYLGESYGERLRSFLAIGRYDALVCAGGPGPEPALADVVRRHEVPVLVVWYGDDVRDAAQSPGIIEIVNQERYRNVASAAWLVDELRELGVNAERLDVIAVQAPAALAPFPKRFRVLTYVPQPKRGGYREPAVYAVASACPEIEFVALGRETPDPNAPANVTFGARVSDVPKLLDESVALLRLREHDGMSAHVLEALSRGRYVVWTQPLPHVRHVLGAPEATVELRALQSLHAAGSLALNTAGREYVVRSSAPAAIAASFEAELHRAVADVPAPERRRSHTVAISGYPLFSARVARSTRALLPDWDAHVLRAGSRAARVFSTMALVNADVWYTIGSPIPDRWLHVLARMLRKPRVIHWVGSDVALLKSQPLVRRFCRSDNVTHLAEVDWMIQELADAGIRASLAPLPPHVRIPDGIPPMPETCTVLLYVPRSRGDFYGRNEYEKLFRAFLGKPIRFVVVGGGELTIPAGANVERLGWKADLSGVYERVSALLRFTRHDGLSLMALEALCYGRHLMWSQPFPYGVRVRDYDECERAVAALLERHLAGELRPHADAAKYVRDCYDQRRCIERIAQFWHARPLETGRPLSTLEAHR